MRILVAYASKYGSTTGIAERIAQVLNDLGEEADAIPVSKAGQLNAYDAYVIGSAAYMGSWLKEATDFVRGNASILATRPVWLFSSGPVGTETVDEKGQDVREAAAPKEFAEFKPTIHPRDAHVFWGRFDHRKLSVAHRVVFAMPAAKKLLPEGDFRDWQEIEAWARSIVESLVATKAAC